MTYTGFTTNPSILLRDQVPACNLRTLSILADQVELYFAIKIYKLARIYTMLCQVCRTYWK